MESYTVSSVLTYVLFVTVMLFRLTSNTSVRNPWDPEKINDLTTPDPTSSQWKNLNHGAKYTGLLYAGRLGFNWIVDIKVQEKDKEFGSVGNLISEKIILTSCRVGERIKNHEDSAVIIYATQYTDEKHTTKHASDSYDVEGVQGKRSIYSVLAHALCSSKILAWDVSIIELKNRVLPIVPYIGYMPIPIDHVKRKIRSSDLTSTKENERRICHVASFGRESLNNPELDTLNYKVHYRIYVLPWTDCTRNMKFLCEEKETCRTGKPDTANAWKLMCLGTRAKVGSVCDHDRGAPIVCEGEVYGIVLRGAQWMYCNNLIHLPFVAQRLDSFEEYFEEVIAERAVYPERPTYSCSSRVYSIISLYINFILLQLVQYS